jgi:hypothetical protein
MKKLYIISLLVALAFIFVQCGTTHITTEDNLNAQIYINGTLKGTKVVSAQRMGLPRKMDITAKYQGNEIGHLSIRRKFTATTFLVGYITYFGYFTAWQYPKEIIIPTTINQQADLWKQPQESIWSQPVKKTH